MTDAYDSRSTPELVTGIYAPTSVSIYPVTNGYVSVKNSNGDIVEKKVINLVSGMNFVTGITMTTTDVTAYNQYEKASYTIPYI